MLFATKIPMATANNNVSQLLIRLCKGDWSLSGMKRSRDVIIDVPLI